MSLEARLGLFNFTGYSWQGKEGLTFRSGTHNGNRRNPVWLDPDYYNINPSREAPKIMQDIHRKAIGAWIEAGCPTSGWEYELTNRRGRRRTRSPSPEGRRSRSRSLERSFENLAIS